MQRSCGRKCLVCVKEAQPIGLGQSNEERRRIWGWRRNDSPDHGELYKAIGITLVLLNMIWESLEGWFWTESGLGINQITLTVVLRIDWKMGMVKAGRPVLMILLPSRWEILFFFKVLFIFREGKVGRKRGRETSMHGCLSNTLPQLGIQAATQICALTRNQTSDPLVHRPALNPLSHTSQGSRWEFLKAWTREEAKELKYIRCSSPSYHQILYHSWKILWHNQRKHFYKNLYIPIQKVIPSLKCLVFLLSLL